MIHTREADDETARGARARFDGTVVLHCFSSPELLAPALERGYYVSFAGNVTYPKADGAPRGGRRGPRRPASSPRPTARTSRRSRCAAGRTSRRTSSTRSRRSPRRAARTSTSSRRRSTRTPTAAFGLAVSASRPKKALGQHFLVDENILGVIGRLAELDARRRRARGRARPRRPHALPRRPRRATSTPSSSTARSSRTLRDALGERTNVDLHWGDALALDLAALEPPPTKLVANLPYNVATPLVVESLDGAADARALVRDGAARGRRPLLRRARDEGVRRRLGARPARTRDGRASIPCRATVFRPPPNVDSALVAFERVAAAAPIADGQARSSRRRSRTGARRSPNSLALAGLAPRERGGGRARRDRPPPGRPRGGARSRRSSSRSRRRSAMSDGAPRPRRSTSPSSSGRSAPTASTRSSTVLQRIDLARPRRARAGATTLDGRRASPTTRSSRGALDAARRRGGRRAALARARSRSGSRSPPASAAAARDAAAALRLANAAARDAARARARSTARRGARRGRPVLPRRRAAARDAATARARAARRCRRTTASCSCCPTATRRRRPRPSTPRSTSATARTGSTSGAPRCSTRARATSRRPRDLAALPAERPRLVAARGRARAPRARSAPTSAAPARPSTGSSRPRPTPRGAARARGRGPHLGRRPPVG